MRVDWMEGSSPPSRALEDDTRIPPLLFTLNDKKEE